MLKRHLLQCSFTIFAAAIMAGGMAAIDWLDRTDPLVSAAYAVLVAILFCVALSLKRVAQYAMED